MLKIHYQQLPPLRAGVSPENKGSSSFLCFYCPLPLLLCLQPEELAMVIFSSYMQHNCAQNILVKIKAVTEFYGSEFYFYFFKLLPDLYFEISSPPALLFSSGPGNSEGEYFACRTANQNIWKKCLFSSRNRTSCCLNWISPFRGKNFTIVSAEPWACTLQISDPIYQRKWQHFESGNWETKNACWTRSQSPNGYNFVVSWGWPLSCLIGGGGGQRHQKGVMFATHCLKIYIFGCRCLLSLPGSTQFVFQAL